MHEPLAISLTSCIAAKVTALIRRIFSMKRAVLSVNTFSGGFGFGRGNHKNSSVSIYSFYG
jgi:hypothetical protein